MDTTVGMVAGDGGPAPMETTAAAVFWHGARRAPPGAVAAPHGVTPRPPWRAIDRRPVPPRRRRPEKNTWRRPPLAPALSPSAPSPSAPSPSRALSDESLKGLPRARNAFRGGHASSEGLMVHVLNVGSILR